MDCRSKPRSFERVAGTRCRPWQLADRRRLPFEIQQEVLGGSIKGTSVDAVDDPLSDPVLSCIAVHGSRGFQLLQVPQNGLISGADAAANVPGRATFGMLPQVAQDFSSQRVDAKNRDHGFCAFWDRGRGANILGHTFILSHRYRTSFHRQIEYDTLREKCQNKSDTMEGVS